MIYQFCVNVLTTLPTVKVPVIVIVYCPATARLIVLIVKMVVERVIVPGTPVVSVKLYTQVPQYV